MSSFMVSESTSLGILSAGYGPAGGKSVAKRGGWRLVMDACGVYDGIGGW